jgi:hypothetical protein
MSLRITCPSCGEDFPVEAGLVEGDGKRAVAVAAAMDPLLGRAALQYLTLFKPAKQSLRVGRAARLLGELADLADEGTVCRDERNGVRRPAPPSLWAAGIERMLIDRGRLELPLENHNYLRAVVFALADKADATAERQRETDLRQGRQGTGVSPPQPREDRLTNELRYIEQLHSYGQLTDEERDQQRADALARHGADRG